MNLEKLSNQFKDQDWFVEVGMDQFDRIVVYVKYLNLSVLQSVPDQFEGKQVLAHFISAKQATREKFVEKLYTYTPKVEEEELSVDDFKSVLNSYRDQCGEETLKDLFYEVHDGKNAVTHFSTVFPSCFNSLQDLYDKYGFDLLAEELGIN